MVEIQELKAAWRGLDDRFAQQSAKLRDIERRYGLVLLQDRMRWVGLKQLVQLAIGVVIVYLGGSYWFDHWGTPHLVAYGLAIHAYGIVLIASAAILMTYVAQLDYRKPLTEVQRQLLKLRRSRIRIERVLLVCVFLIWVPVLFAVLNAFGLDVWETHPKNVLANLLASFVLAGLAGWLTYRFRDRWERDATGRSLRDAEAELRELTTPDQTD